LDDLFDLESTPVRHLRGVEGREAQGGARARSWKPALDHDDTPVDGIVVVNVRAFSVE